jgi:hypothetical protein
MPLLPVSSNPDAVDVDERAVHGRRLGEHRVQIGRERVNERRRGLRRAEHGALQLVRPLQKIGRHVQRLRDHDARHRELEQPVDRLPGRGVGKLREVRELGLAQHLDALGQKVLDESHERHAGAMDVRHRHVTARRERLREDRELEFGLLLLEQAGGREFVHDARGAQGRARRRPAGAIQPRAPSLRR